ncbi:MAG: large subunit ribosomal protein [Fimbriimonadaceae bacterium]|jgi:ribosomal protein L30|nr:large subunit ribosomal protein [Fimbriimonadaceae bacterium]
MLRIKLVKSLIGNTKRNRAIVEALGLRKMHHSIDHRDTPQIRGMLHRVKHMLEVSEISDSEARPRTTGRPKAARTKPPGSVAKVERKRKVRPAPIGKVPKPKVDTRAEEKAALREAQLAAPAKPKAEKPKAEAKPKAEVKPKAEAKPKAAAKPAKEAKAEAKPKATKKADKPADEKRKTK